MYRGLGETYINVFLWLTVCSFVAAAVMVAIPRIFKHFRFAWFFIGTILLGTTLAYVTNKRFHRAMFVRQHQQNNSLIPASGCVCYEPSFGHLFAAYRMNQDEFESWVAQHPWGLVEYDCSFLEHDMQRLGFTDPSHAYATEMDANGGQLRVYFKEGMMYLSYNVM